MSSRLHHFLQASAILFVGAIVAGIVLGRPAFAQLSLQDLPDDFLRRIIENRAGSGMNGRALPTPSGLDRLREGRQEDARTATRQLLELEQERMQKAEEPSQIEEDYSQRAAQRLVQFGYDLFREAGFYETPLTGRVSENYTLGIGDTLIIVRRGRVNQSEEVQVDREGRIVPLSVSPIAAAGRRLGDVIADVQSQIQNTSPGAEISISLGSVRAIGVYVVGAVHEPGLKRLTALSSVMDALAMAGGISKTGSLRRIELVRDGVAKRIDLYDLLLGQGRSFAVELQEGDQIVVPPLGPTVAVAGDATRPGIYELPASGGALSLSHLLNMAGGAIRPDSRVVISRAGSTKRPNAVEAAAASRVSVAHGDIAFIQGSVVQHSGIVMISGHVERAETRALAAAPTLRHLLNDVRIINPDPYPLLGVILRTDPASRQQQYHPVNLNRVLRGKEDVALRDQDEVIIFSREDVRYIAEREVQSVLTTHSLSSAPNCRGLQHLRSLQRNSSPLRFANAIITVPDDFQQRESPAPSAEKAARSGAMAAREGSDAALAGDGSEAASVREWGGQVKSDEVRRAERQAARRAAAARASAWGRASTVNEERHQLEDGARSAECPKVYEHHPDLLSFLVERAVFLNGEVRRPGVYPLVAGVGLDELIEAAGGLSDRADLANIERSSNVREHGTTRLDRVTLDLTSRIFAAVSLTPGDVIRIPEAAAERENGFVVLQGEFVRPGRYDIRRGERLSEVIARAGGLTPQAYPYGAVFLRKSIKERQKEGYDRAARELESNLMAVAQVGNQTGRSDIGTILEAGRGLIQTIRSNEPLGRMTIEADPTVLQVRPELDVLLEPNDRIVIPKRPSEVTVVGAVLNPGSLQFTSGASARDYVEWAGGLQRQADSSRVFIVYPDGKASPTSVSSWNTKSALIPPGSVIVVPQDASAFETWGFIKDLTSILSQLALSAASLVVITR